ncbi:MAG: hypothetical protein H0U59_04185 [Gemmatimonadaceae bacterium]|nr:hypothetical protein [Gemmatimonadaceae bacterium]
MSNKAIDQLLAGVRTQLLKMCDPNHPTSKIILERTGFIPDSNGVPVGAEFVFRMEYVSTVARLAVENASALILPPNLRAAANAAAADAAAATTSPPVESESGNTDNSTQTRPVVEKDPS